MQIITKVQYVYRLCSGAQSAGYLYQTPQQGQAHPSSVFTETEMSKVLSEVCLTEQFYVHVVINFHPSTKPQVINLWFACIPPSFTIFKN